MTNLSEMSTMQALLAREAPYLAAGKTPGFINAPVVFARGQGEYLFDVDGKRYLDFCAGTFTNATGHCHPKVVAFMQQRVAEIWNIHDYASPYRAPLLERLQTLVPAQIDRFMFYSGGSETIEAGIRALRSYLPAHRQTMLAFAGGYHGKTLGAREVFHWQYPGEAASGSILIPFPDQFCSTQTPAELEQASLAAVRAALRAHPSIGAFIFEPILGAGGNLHASKAYWQALQKILREHDVLLFADEICVGFGRTGYDLACQQYDVQADLIAFAKGIASGFPAMVLAGRADIMNCPPFGAPGGGSTTFGSNPLAIAAMYITTEIYLEEQLAARTQQLHSVLASQLQQLQQRYPVIADLRCQGLMATLYLQHGDAAQSSAFALAVHRACLALGLKVMTFDRLFRIAPPLTISHAALEEGCALLGQALQTTLEHSPLSAI